MQNLLLVAQFAPFRSGSLHAAQRMELAADPSSPVLPQRCPSTARPSTATVESDPAASVLQATTRPVRKYTAAAVVACPLQQRIDHLLRHGECAEGYPWATPRQLEGRSVFEAFVACMQSGREGRTCRLLLWRRRCCGAMTAPRHAQRWPRAAAGGGGHHTHGWVWARRHDGERRQLARGRRRTGMHVTSTARLKRACAATPSVCQTPCPCLRRHRAPNHDCAPDGIHAPAVVGCVGRGHRDHLAPESRT